MLNEYKQFLESLLPEKTYGKTSVMSKEEMKSFISDKMKGLLDPHDKEANDSDMEVAIYWFASDYHSGQSSNLYSILSTSEYRPGVYMTSIETENETVKDMYELLVNGDK